MRLPLRHHNVYTLIRLAFAFFFFGVGFYRLVTGQNYPGHLWLTLINQFGLMILGVLIASGVFVRFAKTVFFLFLALTYAVLVDQGWLTPRYAERLATLVVMGFVVYFFYKIFRITLLAKQDTEKRRRHREHFDVVDTQAMLPANSPYHSHLENREFLLADMSKSKNNSLVGFPGCWGTRWHVGPLWFENFFGDTEPPHGADGPLRAVVWQPMHEVPASAGWKHTRLLKYNHLSGFATIQQGKPYEHNWSPHAKRHLKNWRQSASVFEVYHPSLKEWLAAYRQSSQGFLLKFYFVNLIKQLVLTHGESIIFWGVRRRDLSPPLEGGAGGGLPLAGLVTHNIPSAKHSRHIASFITSAGKSTPIGIGLIDAWFADCQNKQLTWLDFGVFWTPTDPESWKGFSRFKSQFGITYISYPKARLRRAGSLRNLFPAILKR